MKKIAVLTAAALVAASATASAQRVHEVPARPALWAGADSNSAGTYYLLGVQRLERDPRTAAAAFYWAERLSPGWPDALYGRYVALLMTDVHRQTAYIEGTGGIDRNPEIRAIDSLYFRAVQRDPFLHHKLEKQYFMQYLRAAYSDYVRDATGNRDDAAASYMLNSALQNADPEDRAWLAYAEGRFPAAIAGYEQILRHTRHPARLRLRLGQMRYLAGDFDSAAVDLRAGIDELRRQDAHEVVRVYESKAMLELSLGAALEQAGHADSAREEYGKALQEDLAFWPGHRRMSAVAMAHGDTTTALSEMGLAVEIAPDEPDLRFDYGVLLLSAHKVLESAEQMKKAVELDPFYATPHFYLAAMNDASSMTDDAVEHYRHFLALASRDDEHRPQAEARLAALTAPAASASH